MIRNNFPTLLLTAPTLFLAGSAFAQDAELGGIVRDLANQLGGAEAGNDSVTSFSGRLIQLFALITVLSIAPGLLVMATSFTRFVIVFSMLRSALGLNQTPPNIVLNGMALFMTLFVMQPVFDDAWEAGLQPLLNNTISEEEAISRIGQPFHNFMLTNVREKDLVLFRELAGDETPDILPNDTSEIGWRELMPAFMISELRRAFTIGFLLYLPFIAIDLIVASVLMSAGMIMLPPVIVSLPFKIIFFVLIDGWYLLAGSLMESYNTVQAF